MEASLKVNLYFVCVEHILALFEYAYKSIFSEYTLVMNQQIVPQHRHGMPSL